MDAASLSVVIVTYERAAFLRRCLESLRDQRSDVKDVIVVDASEVSVGPAVQGLGLGVTYVHAPELAGWMTRSRNRALLHVSGEIIAFLDDDVTVREGWATALRQAYAATGADAAAGRTCNGLPGEERYDKPVGRLCTDGQLTDGFASDTEGLQEIDHGIGANMSFSRDVLLLLGGFRDDYPGTALREDTDMFLRVRRLGRTAIFVPEAVVDHRPAPHVTGRRFDTRYKLYGRRNHMVLLARHAGAGSPMLRRWIRLQIREIPHAGGPRRRVERFGVVLAGLGFGAAALIRQGRWGPWEPPRTGVEADEVRRALSRRV